MKTKNSNYLIFAFLLIFIGINSCGITPPYDEEIIDYVVNNNSDHTITTISFFGNDIDTTCINVNEEKITTINALTIDEDVETPFSSCDSVIVIYNDSISIQHYPDNPQVATRSIIIYTNWVKNNVEKFEYIFTNDDYQEALNQ